MPLKQPKPKTPQQVEELIELFRLAKSKIRVGCCFNCEIAISLYQCSIDTLLWADGSKPKNFCLMVRQLKRGYSITTKHQHSHSE